MQLASRIAINRTVAGVHYPVDSMAGCLLGLTMGNYLVARSTGKASYVAWTFQGEAVVSNEDFNWQALLDVNATDAGTQVSNASYVIEDGEQNEERLGSPILAWLWKKAVDEWA
jgi:hypothetical protein